MLDQSRSDQITHTNGHVRRNGSAPSVDDLLGTLTELASRPLAEAQALPLQFYTDEQLYQLEVERIWQRSWIYVGRRENLSKPGDWMSLEIAGEPIVVTLAENNQLRAMSRVCSHRFMDVLAHESKSCGHADTFVCPYHNWTYNMDGKLAGAPLMERNELFQRERETIRLRQYSVTDWRGFIFVNLDPDAAALEPALSEVDEYFGNYKPEEWKLVDKIEWGEVDGNWKLVMDNGREAYHHQGLHKDTLEPLWPAHMVLLEETMGDFWLGRMFVSPDAAVGEEDGHLINPVMLPAAPGLTPFERSHYIVAGIYPSFVVAPGPDVMFTLRWVPYGPTRHATDIEIIVHESRAEECTPEVLQELRDWISAVQAEDVSAAGSIQKMASSHAVTKGGPLSHLERTVWQFQRYLARRLTNAAL